MAKWGRGLQSQSCTRMGIFQTSPGEHVLHSGLGAQECARLLREHTGMAKNWALVPPSSATKILRREGQDGTFILQKQPFMRSRNDAVRCYVSLEANGAGTTVKVEFSPPKRFALLLKAWAILLAASAIFQYPWILSSYRRQDPMGGIFMAIAIPAVALGWLYIAFAYRLELRQRFFLNFLKQYLHTY